MPTGNITVKTIDNRVIEKVAALSAPLIGRLPTAKEEHRRVIILLGLGCTQAQTARISGYSEVRIEQLKSIYKQHIKAVSLERDLCVVGVLDQAIGMAGDRLNQALENVDLTKPNTADIMRLANSIESLRRTAYDLRSSSMHGEKPGKQVVRPSAITLESLDAAMVKAKRLKQGAKDEKDERIETAREERNDVGEGNGGRGHDAEGLHAEHEDDRIHDEKGEGASPDGDAHDEEWVKKGSPNQ